MGEFVISSKLPVPGTFVKANFDKFVYERRHDGRARNIVYRLNEFEMILVITVVVKGNIELMVVCPDGTVGWTWYPGMRVLCGV